MKPDTTAIDKLMRISAGGRTKDVDPRSLLDNRMVLRVPTGGRKDPMGLVHKAARLACPKDWQRRFEFAKADGEPYLYIVATPADAENIDGHLGDITNGKVLCEPASAKAAIRSGWFA